MTVWLERKEKIIRHDSYITWCLTGKPITSRLEKTLEIPTERIKMTKHPTRKKVSMESICTDYMAPYIEDALARYIVKFKNPDLSERQVERQAETYNVLFNSLAVYHSMKIWLGNMDHHRLSGDENDIIHARPSRQDKYKRVVAGRFDTVLIKDDSRQDLELRGKLLYHTVNNSY